MRLEREKKSDGLEKGKQILGEKTKSKKSDFGFFLGAGGGGGHVRRETNFWEILDAKNKRRHIYFEEKIKIKEDNFN